MKRIESTSFSFDYVPSTSTKNHQEQTHIHGITKTGTTKKKKSSNKREIQEYDNLENVTKTKQKPKIEQKVKEKFIHKQIKNHLNKFS
jgi:hypothetical protein